TPTNNSNGGRKAKLQPIRRSPRVSSLRRASRFCRITPLTSLSRPTPPSYAEGAVRWPIAIAAALLLTSLFGAVSGCGAGGGATASGPRPTRSTIGLSSSAFLNGSSIPSRYTCDGEGTAPPITWTRVPARARSLALLVEDQNAPGGAFVHWSVYDLPRG